MVYIYHMLLYVETYRKKQTIKNEINTTNTVASLVILVVCPLILYTCSRTVYVTNNMAAIAVGHMIRDTCCRVQLVPGMIGMVVPAALPWP